MIQLPHVKARVARLEELTHGLAKEVTSWKGRESPLLASERLQYLDALQDALAGLDAARVTLAAAVKRMEALPNPAGVNKG